MCATLGREQRVEGTVVDLPEQLLAILVGIEVTEIGTKHPAAHRLAVLQTEETLCVDILQLAVIGTDRGALLIERVVAAGVVERIGTDLALRHMAEHRLHLVVTAFVAQVR
ncbi:hypothetical protein D3C76_1013810 [compost metagenome]